MINVFKMGWHETERLNEFISVTRVPTGWVYHFKLGKNTEEINSVFVPQPDNNYKKKKPDKALQPPFEN